MLITVEGIDGSGKSAACEALAQAMPDATMTAEPTDSWYGDAVRRSVGEDDADPLAELFLYTADHADHLSRLVRPALERGETVISDRFSDSRYAYQGASLQGVLPDPVEFVQELHAPWTRVPDRTIYLDASPAVGAARSAGANKFEREQFLARVAENYDRLMAAEPGRFERIDAERPLDSVVADVERIVAEALEDE